MVFQLGFNSWSKYDSLKTGITISAVLQYGDLTATCDAKIDTGSEICLFERELGELLEIDIETGFPKSLSTLTGELMAYGHEIILETLGIEFQTFVYFAESYEVRRNLLGREGWLQLVKIGVVDYDSEIYLSPYGEISP